MYRNGLWSEARDLVVRFKSRIRENPKLLQTWASLEVAYPGELSAEELLKPEFLQRFESAGNFSLVAQILIKAGRREEAKLRSITHLTTALRQRESSDIFYAARSLVELGELSDFRKLVQETLPERLANRVVAAVLDDRQYEMPNPWEFDQRF